MTPEELKLIDRLFSLWEGLAEAGELRIGVGFGKNFDELKTQVESLKTKYSQDPIPTTQN